MPGPKMEEASEADRIAFEKAEAWSVQGLAVVQGLATQMLRRVCTGSVEVGVEPLRIREGVAK